jgi:hypothetical protein
MKKRLASNDSADRWLAVKAPGAGALDVTVGCKAIHHSPVFGAGSRRQQPTEGLACLRFNFKAATEAYQHGTIRISDARCG